ncbi:hypothetical protein LXA43DRAFT_931991 [Ganoderma leucocontextum]|nr:hypothetical protein LXA43DRAFT_956894 [Ganoderma leucocontextum]KAI1782911.1 hypothetical protein LXA43DRAFT_931991 [Ganoderma leucocontextum]
MSAVNILSESLLSRAADPGPHSNLDPSQVPHAQQAPPISAFVPVLTSSSPASTPIDDLRARVEAILDVFDDPRYAHLDIPDWVHRATSYGTVRHAFTVRSLIRAMRDAAADLGLAESERYVLAAVCSCVEDANKAITHTAEYPEALARGLQRLANAWVAFLLWPFYAPMKDDENMATGFASPCIGLAFTPKAMAAGEVNPDADSRVCASSYPLQEQILRRDGYRCVVSGVWDTRYWKSMRRRLRRTQGIIPDGTHAWTDAVRIFKHPLVVYKDVYDNDEPKRDSTRLSLELLRRYCQLSDRYIQDMGSGVMDDPENLITLSIMAHKKFDHFAFCLVPTQTPNTYRVKDHRPQVCGLPFPSMTVPDTITFRDHSGAVVDDDDDGRRPGLQLQLPKPELLRAHAALGSVLYASGVAGIFDRIVYTMSFHRRDEVGDLPLPTPDGVSFWQEVVDSDGDVLDRVVQPFAAMYIA